MTIDETSTTMVNEVTWVERRLGIFNAAFNDEFEMVKKRYNKIISPKKYEDTDGSHKGLFNCYCSI